ncbi:MULTISPECIES: winged helix-turn-helix domain-containing protein [Ralstonia]|uniref:Phosphate regulon transcriptional regulatory protein phoB n=1 Tax=Ralstonia mannitolilytica TaxID=105219 RepID=A0AAJ4ZI36_9RALS|nr:MULTISPECIES: winged helix-turn-helix domain-containing protein [Ralstonia]AJW43859.1 transcriptional regulator [Ralstonia mannitolilytica]MBU9579907.1 winged helix-turn-helix domain-containing protein [Ralstonia mannitolilytica]PLT16436.1 DNA-binding response regulator [Ralstonia mannitolilytica]QIF09089.1 response regulator [Ralstonia mannitolilytica]CAJ0728344.1 Phosphate regulon transcriptional regulatory protein PhoB [Ralstonia mannitolilytica]
MGIQIMLVEQDQAEGDRLSFSLRDGGHEVVRVSHPAQAQGAIQQTAPELLLMEWTWPERESIDMLLALRANTQTRGLPVIVLSRHGDARAKIAALDAGADDYVVKPCDTGELHARIRAVVRRRAPQQHGDDVLQVNGLRLDPLTLGVTAQTDTGPRAIPLSPLEFRLLHFLVAHPQRVHSRTQLLDRVWGNHVFVGERTVDVHVRKLRVALAGTACDGLIQTVRGGGYRLVVGAGGASAAHAADTIGMQLEAATRKAGPVVESPFARAPIRPAAVRMSA